MNCFLFLLRINIISLVPHVCVYVRVSATKNATEGNNGKQQVRTHEKCLWSTLTDLAKGDPVHAVEASGAEREADGGADDGVGAGDGQLEEGRHQVPDGASTCAGVTH